MVGGIGSSVYGSYFANVNSSIRNNNQSIPCQNVDLYGWNGVRMGISKEASEKLKAEVKEPIDLRFYIDPNILDKTDCETVEQVRYIYEKYSTVYVDEFRNIVKNRHFLPMFHTLEDAGYTPSFNIDEIMQKLDINELINIDKQLNDAQTQEEKLRAYSDIFGRLSKYQNLSKNAQNELSKLAELFENLALKAANKKSSEYSDDLLLKMLKETKQEQGYLVYENEDVYTKKCNKYKYIDSQIAKYQR